MIKKFRLILALILPAISASALTSVDGLRCEYRVNPQGIDMTAPRLSWVIQSDQRGDEQTAYQVLVASSPRLLAQNQGDLWDSGEVMTNSPLNLVYAGSLLSSRQQCYWQVRIWDHAGNPSPWSTPASWSMGLLNPADWQAQWISDPVLADPANRPLTPIHCYLSTLTNNSVAGKWITLDLGTSQTINAVDLLAARPARENADFRTFMFPSRFKIEVANSADFSYAQTVVDQTGADYYPNPRAQRCHFPFSAVTARYVRLSVTKLSMWDGQDYGLALGGFQVFNGSRQVAIQVPVSCSDSIENSLWSKMFLVDGRGAVAIAPDSPALTVKDVPGVPASRAISRVPMLRREFNLTGGIQRAVLSVTARGFYEARINGQRVGNELLAPGFTSYSQRLQYQTYDVTSMLHTGTNAIGALLGYGWYAGHMNLGGNRCFYGTFPQFLAQLDVQTSNGQWITIVTDGSWRSTLSGPVRYSDLLDGEAYDGTLEQTGWDSPGFDDHNWANVWTQPRDNTPLVWQRCQPVQEIQDFNPVAVNQVSPGVYVYDFGQEISGWCQLQVNGPAGTHIVLRHAEEISPDGNINVANLWGTAQQEDYILDGKSERTLEPHFTYHGFRYVEVTGLPQPPGTNTVIAVNIHSALPEVGNFTCSNPLFNRIMTAAQWTQRNLLFDVPAGCAARSERVAWLGDVRPCVQAACFNFDAADFFSKYEQDIRDAQAHNPDGRYCDITPHAHLEYTDICVGSPGWADCGVSLPWEEYVNYGDLQALAAHYASAKQWVDYVAGQNPDFIWQNSRGQDWGDWESAGTPTPKDLGSTAFFAHSADLVARMAGVLGYTNDVVKYGTLFTNIKQAFVKHYVSTDGIIGGVSPDKPAMRDVAGIVRSLVKNGKLAFVVKNEVLGGDPALGRLKKLHLAYRIGSETQVQVFDEDSAVDLVGKNGKPLEIVSASYGYDSTDLEDTQGSYALALKFSLLDEPLRSKAARRLAELVVKNKYHPTTGFWSSIELLLALSNSGYNEDAAEMVDQHSQPSWGYMAKYNTTMWEAFDANTKNLSLNHWTHSAVGEWLWRNVAGLNSDEQNPGYQSFTVRPRPTGEVNWCKSTYNSVRGPIQVDWRQEKKQFALDLTVPVTATAIVYLPAARPADVREGGQPVTEVNGIHWLRQDDGVAVFQVESGSYHFVSEEKSTLAQNPR